MKCSFDVNRSVIVTGATSPVGDYLLPRLVHAGFDIHALSRKPPRPPDESGLIWYQIESANDFQHPTIPTCTTLIHLAPLWILPQLLEGLGARGILRIVAFSSTSRFSKLTSPNPKEREIAQRLITAEATLIATCARSSITWTLFRPTLIYAPGRDKNVSMIANFIKRFGIFPLIGQAQGLRQPVHADDLALATLDVLDCTATFNQSYNLSGGETLTYRKMIEAIFHALGRKPRFLPIPAGVFSIMLKTLHHIPAYQHITIEMASRMNTDFSFDHHTATRDFGYSPRAFAPVTLSTALKSSGLSHLKA